MTELEKRMSHPFPAGERVSPEEMAELRELARKIPLHDWRYGDDTGNPCVMACRQGDIEELCFQISERSFAGRQEETLWMAMANPRLVLSLLDEIECWRKRFETEQPDPES